MDEGYTVIRSATVEKMAGITVSQCTSIFALLSIGLFSTFLINNYNTGTPESLPVDTFKNEDLTTTIATTLLIADPPKTECNCDQHSFLIRPHDYNDRIAPWMVFIYQKATDAEENDSGYGPYRYLCDGSIINENWIISAASCVYQYSKLSYVDYSKSRLLSAAGRYYKDINNPANDMGTEQHVLVSRIILPTEYRPGFTTADIALLKAYKPFTLNQYVQPVAIWWQTEYDSCEILTWKTDQSDYQREVLRRSSFIEEHWKTLDCYQAPVL